MQARAQGIDSLRLEACLPAFNALTDSLARARCQAARAASAHLLLHWLVHRFTAADGGGNGELSFIGVRKSQL